MQFGIFTVGDVTTDPTNGTTPTEHERIKATVAIARKAEEVGLDVFATGVRGLVGFDCLRSCLGVRFLAEHLFHQFAGLCRELPALVGKILQSAGLHRLARDGGL